MYYVGNNQQIVHASDPRITGPIHNNPYFLGTEFAHCYFVHFYEHKLAIKGGNFLSG
jgi:hypothetical protein